MSITDRPQRDPTRRTRPRWVLLGALIVAYVLALIVGQYTPAANPAPRPEDELAAGLADASLLRQLNIVAAEADDADRVDAVEAWLRSPDHEFVSGIRGAWTIGAREGASIPLVVYEYVEDGSLIFPTGTQWGHVCRIYTMSDTVSVEPLTCPDGTPEKATPGLDTKVFF